MTQLGVSLAMGSHCVTCYPTQMNTPRLNPSHTGWYSIYLSRRDGRLSWPSWLDTPRPGVEPATFRSRVQRSTTVPPRHRVRRGLAARVLQATCHISQHGFTMGSVLLFPLLKPSTHYAHGMPAESVLTAFTTAADRQRLQAIIRRSVRTGLCRTSGNYPATANLTHTRCWQSNVTDQRKVA